jgi:hypothetical protein
MRAPLWVRTTLRDIARRMTPRRIRERNAGKPWTEAEVDHMRYAWFYGMTSMIDLGRLLKRTPEEVKARLAEEFVNTGKAWTDSDYDEFKRRWWSGKETLEELSKYYKRDPKELDAIADMAGM